MIIVSGSVPTERSEVVPTVSDEYPESSPYVSAIIVTDDAVGRAAAAVIKVAYICGRPKNITAILESRQMIMGNATSLIMLK